MNYLLHGQFLHNDFKSNTPNAVIYGAHNLIKSCLIDVSGNGEFYLHFYDGIQNKSYWTFLDWVRLWTAGHAILMKYAWYKLKQFFMVVEILNSILVPGQVNRQNSLDKKNEIKWFCLTDTKT